MNILFCGDKNVEDGIFLSVLSLMKHTERPLDIYIFTMNLNQPECHCEGIKKRFISGLEAEMRKKNPKHKVHFFDMTEIVMADFPEKNIDSYFTPCCLLRLYADKLKDFPEKVLYLDTDVMANANFDELYDTDISDYELAGVLDYYGKHFFHQKNLFTRDYMNSGVMLLNMRRIRETGLFEKCRKMCATEKMFLSDQTALNRCVTEKKLLPRKWNEQKKMRKDTALRHFSNILHFFPWFHVHKVKPWNVEELHKRLRTYEFDDIIDYYRKHIKEVKGW